MFIRHLHKEPSRWYAEIFNLFDLWHSCNEEKLIIEKLAQGRRVLRDRGKGLATGSLKYARLCLPFATGAAKSGGKLDESTLLQRVKYQPLRRFHEMDGPQPLVCFLATSWDLQRDSTSRPLQDVDVGKSPLPVIRLLRRQLGDSSGLCAKIGK